MKFLASVVVLIFLFAGCANRATSPASHFVIPNSCITDLRFTKTAVCHPLTNGSFSCDGLVVHAACLKAQR
jgi:PBP1b-binding outer membrane lipoprotein LpoB